MTLRSLKARRRAARNEADAVIRTMTDADLRNTAAELGRQIGQEQRLIAELRMRLGAARHELERRRTSTSAGIHISDHAVVRYLERVKGVDIAAVREEITCLAQRVGQSGEGADAYARRRDEETGLIVAMNERSGVVTTVFSDDETSVFAVPTEGA